MTAANPIRLAEFEASTRGTGKSVFFPPEAYTSEAFHRFEQAAVWRKEWVCVGRAEEIPNVGDYFTITVADEPIIVIRAADDRISAMSAVCQHRAMVLVEGAGHCKGRFVCPYHRWTYDRDGRLVGAPDMDGVEPFVRENIRLPQVRVEIWHGIIFVNFDRDAAPLADRLAALEPIVADWRLEDLRGEFQMDPNYKMTFDYPWNWKVYAEGQSECYHCDKLHGDTPTMAGLDFDSADMKVMDPAAGVFAFTMRARYVDHTLNHLGRAVFPPIPTLSEDERWLSTSIVIAPNVFIQLMADSVIVLSWLPTGPTGMRAKRHRLYPAETLALPEFPEVHKLETAAIRHFVEQDDVAFVRVQQGLGSSFAPRGPISRREPILAGLNQWLVERYRAAEAAPR
ncbi:MAG: aromatic ring-hydroxylating dioxygenase subunit alpha [Caulobacteraceae bacterium]